MGTGCEVKEVHGGNLDFQFVTFSQKEHKIHSKKENWTQEVSRLVTRNIDQLENVVDFFNILRPNFQEMFFTEQICICQEPPISSRRFSF